MHEKCMAGGGRREGRTYCHKVRTEDEAQLLLFTSKSAESSLPVIQATRRDASPSRLRVKERVQR